MNFDVAIIGAGIVGAACAASLAREGLSVVVIDGVGPASGATAAAMGHIVAMDDSEAQFALTSYSQKLWNSLADEMPERSEFCQSCQVCKENIPKVCDFLSISGQRTIHLCLPTLRFASQQVVCLLQLFVADSIV